MWGGLVWRGLGGGERVWILGVCLPRNRTEFAGSHVARAALLPSSSAWLPVQYVSRSGLLVRGHAACPSAVAVFLVAWYEEVTQAAERTPGSCRSKIEGGSIMK